MENTEQTESEKGLKAKGVSLWGQIIGAVWVAGWSTWQNVNDILGGRHIDTADIGMQAAVIVACFSPIFINLVMDKIKAIKAA